MRKRLNCFSWRRLRATSGSGLDFTHAGKYLRAADIAFGNLETVVADREHLDGDGHGPRTDEWMIGAYVNAGFKVMNLANNPSMYRGVKGLLAPSRCSIKPALPTGEGEKISKKRGVLRWSSEKESRLPSFVALRFAPLTPRATAQRAGLAVVRVATAYEAPSLLPKEVPGAPPIVHTIPNAADVEALREDIASAESKPMWWLCRGTGESLRSAAEKASSWDTKLKWPILQ